MLKDLEGLETCCDNLITRPIIKTDDVALIIEFLNKEPGCGCFNQFVIGQLNQIACEGWQICTLVYLYVSKSQRDSLLLAGWINNLKS